MNIYTIRDTLLQECGPIFIIKNDSVATRSYHEFMKDNPNPECYKLLRVGTFEPESGLIAPCEILEISTDQGVLDVDL